MQCHLVRDELIAAAAEGRDPAESALRHAHVCPACGSVWRGLVRVADAAAAFREVAAMRAPSAARISARVQRRDEPFRRIAPIAVVVFGVMILSVCSMSRHVALRDQRRADTVVLANHETDPSDLFELVLLVGEL